MAATAGSNAKTRFESLIKVSFCSSAEPLQSFFFLQSDSIGPDLDKKLTRGMLVSVVACFPLNLQFVCIRGFLQLTKSIKTHGETLHCPAGLRDEPKWRFGCFCLFVS